MQASAQRETHRTTKIAPSPAQMDLVCANFGRGRSQPRRSAHIQDRTQIGRERALVGENPFSFSLCVISTIFVNKNPGFFKLVAAKRLDQFWSTLVVRRWIWHRTATERRSACVTWPAAHTVLRGGSGRAHAHYAPCMRARWGRKGTSTRARRAPPQRTSAGRSPSEWERGQGPSGTN